MCHPPCSLLVACGCPSVQPLGFSRCERPACIFLWHHGLPSGFPQCLVCVRFEVPFPGDSVPPGPWSLGRPAAAGSPSPPPSAPLSPCCLVHPIGGVSGPTAPAVLGFSPVHTHYLCCSTPLHIAQKVVSNAGVSVASVERKGTSFREDGPHQIGVLEYLHVAWETTHF